MKEDRENKKSNIINVRYNDLLRKEMRLEKLEIENEELHSLVDKCTDENDLFWQLYEFSHEHPREFENEYQRLRLIVEESERTLTPQRVADFKENTESLRIFDKIQTINRQIEAMDENNKTLWQTLIVLKNTDSNTEEGYSKNLRN